MLCKTSLVLILVAINGFFVAAEFALVKLRVQETR
jgi:CBS domain containing-hemolysin-like protein